MELNNGIFNQILCLYQVIMMLHFLNDFQSTQKSIPTSLSLVLMGEELVN